MGKYSSKGLSKEARKSMSKKYNSDDTKVRISEDAEKRYQEALAKWNKVRKEGLKDPGPKPKRSQFINNK